MDRPTDTDTLAARIAYRVAAGLHSTLPTATTAPTMVPTTREGGR